MVGVCVVKFEKYIHQEVLECHLSLSYIQGDMDIIVSILTELKVYAFPIN